MAATTKVLTTSGKRKTATARATVRKGTGIIRINKVPLDIVQPELVRLKVSEPVLIAGPTVVKSLNIDVDVRGGGIMGQAEAARCAIARGIINWTNDVALRDAYLAHDRNILVNDVRVERVQEVRRTGRKSQVPEVVPLKTTGGIFSPHTMETIINDTRKMFHLWQGRIRGVGRVQGPRRGEEKEPAKR